jgi:hypothetical protein
MEVGWQKRSVSNLLAFPKLIWKFEISSLRDTFALYVNIYVTGKNLTHPVLFIVSRLYRYL